MKSEIEEELSLIFYLIRNREFDYQQLINWVGKRYNDGDIFVSIMHNSTCIADVKESLEQQFSIYEPNQDILLSKIAGEYLSSKISLLETIHRAYDLLNLEGDGLHELSSLLYSLVDDFTNESPPELIERAKSNNFSFLLEKFNEGKFKNLYARLQN